MYECSVCECSVHEWCIDYTREVDLTRICYLSQALQLVLHGGDASAADSPKGHLKRTLVRALGRLCQTHKNTHAAAGTEVRVGL
jgi:hypothetical protein